MISHIAIWVLDLEKMKDFYIKYFDGKSSDMYQNVNTDFKSYFLTFSNGSNLELMQSPFVIETKNSKDLQYLGLAHIAFSVGSISAVDKLTERLIKDGYKLISGPRATGDGYYESCMLDAELNKIEIT
ncbi:MAG: VOC family protein, partial [Firmicutes bacterium]|nr:VOC family protein [Bacillota bacterium]